MNKSTSTPKAYGITVFGVLLSPHRLAESHAGTTLRRTQASEPAAQRLIARRSLSSRRTHSNSSRTVATLPTVAVEMIHG